jgi:hypothetical protein
MKNDNSQIILFGREQRWATVLIRTSSDYFKAIADFRIPRERKKQPLVVKTVLNRGLPVLKIQR